MNVSKMIIAIFALAGLGAALTGCGGGGVVATSPFAGTRDIGFYDADHSNSSWSGDFEVVVNKDGNFDTFGIVWTYGEDSGHKGKVLSGWIKPDRTFHVVAKIDTLTWPEPGGPLPDPYYMVADGQLVPSGGHYEGTVQVKYYESADFSPGMEVKNIPYDAMMYHLPDRSATKPKTEADFVNFLKKLE